VSFYSFFDPARAIYEWCAESVDCWNYGQLTAKAGAMAILARARQFRHPSHSPINEDLLWFLKALKIDRLSLVGLSNYAIALDFTIAYP